MTKREQSANLRSADADPPRPQPPHWTLIILLVATQAGYGMLLANVAGGWWGRYLAVPVPWAFALVGVGMLASVAHLGKPLRAWRISHGVRRSWLSREAVCFGISAALLGAHLLNAALLRRYHRALPVFDDWSGVAFNAGVLLGLIGVGCSIMIHVDTHRHIWRGALTTARMGGTLLVAAAGALLPLAAAGILAAKLVVEASSLFGQSHPARLQREVLGLAVVLRFALGGSAVFTFAIGNLPVAFLVWLGGELAERYLFFRTVDAPQMPGIPAR